jgi:hypothetical protein
LHDQRGVFGRAFFVRQVAKAGQRDQHRSRHNPVNLP